MPVVVAPLRTPIGRFGGGLSEVRPDDLLALVFAAVVEKAGIDAADIEEVASGCANQAGEDNRNVSRMAALLAGFPHSVPGYTVNRLCASGLEAVNQAARAVRAGDARIVMAGGVESMSRAPFSLPRVPPKTGGYTAFDTSLGWRYPNPKMEALFPLEAMGETAENLVDRFGISREDQDAFAVASHQKACAADFSAEIIPVPRAKAEALAKDEGPRADSSLEGLAKLKPAFRKGGSVTAGNSSTLNDGAAAMLIVDDALAAERGLPVMGRILASSSAGVDPRVMGIGPVPAVRTLLQRAGLSVGDIAGWELNEAFAAQSLAVIRELGLPMERVNVRGGAIALGHPLGCSGARLIVSLLHSLKPGEKGIATLCVGVGQGVATLVERV
jgi:acetyl-CoA acyltransferase